MINWQKFPFVRFMLAFVGGILFNIYFQNSIKPVFILSNISVFIYLTFWILQKHYIKTELKTFLGFVALVLLFCLGNLSTHLHIEKNHKNHIANIKKEIKAYEGTIIQPLQEKEKSFKTVISVQKVLIDSIWIPKEGKVLVYFQKSDNTARLKYGNQIIVESIITNIAPPSNPNAFDYKEYLSYQNIYNQSFIKINSFVVIGYNIPNILKHYAFIARAFLDKNLSKYFNKQREKGIALALILGVKDDLENEIRNVYSEVGAMHVLAVSGLHVGLVYKIFQWLFGFIFFKKRKYNDLLEAFILILLIWVYAFITGLSPSVMRAATMFSFVILGNGFKRSSNIYNTLAISAFILLLINPFYISEVGFILSYLAVIGIVYLQQKIYDLLDIQNIWIDNVWKLTTVALAAQVATSPISIYYFHQFPNYFFISNLIAIPAATLILSLGLFTELFWWNNYLLEKLTWVLEKLIFITNEIMLFVSHLPYASSKELEISGIQTLLLYAAILFLILFISFKKFKYYLLCFSSVLLFFLLNIYFWSLNNKSIQSVIYDVSGKSALGLRNGHTMFFVYSDSLYYNDKLMSFNITNHWQKNKINLVKSIDLNKENEAADLKISPFLNNNLVVWNKKTFFLIDEPLEKIENQMKFDYVILRDNVRLNDQFYNNIKFNKLILDSSCKKWYADLNQKFLKSNLAHIVCVDGALLLDFNN